MSTPTVALAGESDRVTWLYARRSAQLETVVQLADNDRPPPTQAPAPPYRA